MASEKHLLPYLTDKPAAFQDAADINILLDSGDILPVHSIYLTAHSSVLCDMVLTEGVSYEGRIWPKKDLKLPLPDTTYEEACDFLTALYSFEGQKSISTDMLPSVAKIAHKFDMSKILDSCDERLANLANFDGKSASDIQLWVSLTV